MTEIKQFDVVALKEDLLSENLFEGQVGTVVEVYNDGEGYEVEFVDKDGNTYGLVTLNPQQLLALHYEPVRVAA